MEINHVILHTKNIMQMKNFYIDNLEFTLLKDDEKSLRFAVGRSILEFIATETVNQPFYHFAFSIPFNKFKEAKLWIQKRVKLTVEDGKDEVYFNNLQADAFYFTDPGGNIVEFIARHSLSEEGSEPFSSNSVINISEMSLTVNDSISAGKMLNEIDVHERDNNEINKNGLNFMGEKENGVFLLLTQPGRKWLFSNKQSTIYPLEISLSNTRKIIINTDNKIVVYSNENRPPVL